MSGADKLSSGDDAALQRWITLMELLDLPRVQSELVHVVTRRGEMSLDDICFELKKKQSEAEELHDDLLVWGFIKDLKIKWELRYKIMIARKKAGIALEHLGRPGWLRRVEHAYGG